MMNSHSIRGYVPTWMLVILCFTFGSTDAAESNSGAVAKPLKVFILAGQSNMQGHVHISTFDALADDPATAMLLRESVD